MNGTKIWVIDHKASLTAYSPMNIDGSDWILGVYLVAADSAQTAQEKFDSFLQQEEMELIEIFDVSHFEESKFNDNSNRSKQITNANRLICEQGGDCYVFARTSESLAQGAEGDNQND